MPSEFNAEFKTTNVHTELINIKVVKTMQY